MAQKSVGVGQLYRSTEGGLFGGPGPEWQVVSVARRHDGVTYATLAMAQDPTELKSLAMGVLLDRRAYILIADA